MFSLIRRYTKWLHTQWPAGRIEKLPVVDEHGQTNIPGIYVVGDLTGIPLLKFSLDTGARAVSTIAADSSFKSQREKGGDDVVDVAIVGGGVSGFAAAVEAKKHGLSYILFEASQPLSTIVNFPKGKPIYTYPKEMTPSGDLQVSAEIKEALVEELEGQIKEHGIEPRQSHVEKVAKKGTGFEVVLSKEEPIQARRVIIAIGRSGNHRKLGIPGEDLDKVYNRLHDPKDFCGKTALIVGGGDSALETAIALAQCGGQVTVSYRKPEFSRPKPDNIERIEMLQADPMADVAVEDPVSERVTTAAGGYMHEHKKPGSINLMMASKPKEIRSDSVVIEDSDGNDQTLPNDVVFTMIGREAPLQFFRRSGIRIHGEYTVANYAAMAAFLLFCIWMYLWKAGGNPVANVFHTNGWFPFNFTESLAHLIETPQRLLGTLSISMTEPGLYYGLAYVFIVLIFGIRRIKRRKTPYVTVQTWTLIMIQVIPLFILPYILFPWLGHNNLLPQWFANAFFPECDYGHGREYWRASGFILAWPLFIYNVFTDQPLWAWLGVCFFQTFVLIPGLIYYFGKGSYCGWICSCGALAETLGDTHRTKMPHGPFWNRLNMAGQVILFFAFFLLFLRVLGWLGVPGMAGVFYFLKDPIYKYFVDVTLAGIIGVGLYFWYSGRVWCRTFCPLAALMHIYARFSRFSILSEKKKCISCNVCTSVCHQGIDIMNFANKGMPMNDPECVRCSACVQSCPTGVLTFGQVDSQGNILRTDRLAASPVQMREGA